jgi:D-alanyl-D-alanine endopeptidase (penicillin-binding protein 7)
MIKKLLFLLLSTPSLLWATTHSVVFNITTQQVIDGSLNNSEMSIASISKLMTVYTVLKENQNLNQKLTVKSHKHISNTKLNAGMVLTREDLIKLALISSDNLAAITLSENFPAGETNFVRTMNKNAVELNMVHSKFVEPTGLSPMNISTINDLINLTETVSKYGVFRDAAQSHSAIGEIQKGKKTTKLKRNPTSKYFGNDGIVTIKTGFTNAAGFCITMLVYSKDNLYNITILGAKSKKERQLLVEKSLSKISKT